MGSATLCVCVFERDGERKGERGVDLKLKRKVRVRS